MLQSGAALRSIVAALVFGGCQVHAPAQPQPQPPVAAKPIDRLAMLEESIARQLLDASPPADPADTRARDAAAAKLSRLRDLLDAAGDRILWGGFDPQKGYEPNANSLTAFSPFVWAKLYLSTFTFARPYDVRQEGRFAVLEVPARFRDRLDAGDYPYPFWHSARKWQRYVDTRAILFVFDKGRLVAAYRRSAPDSGHEVAGTWDSRWHWTDAAGHEGPRVALFTYLFAADNPWLTRLDRTYRSLESEFRTNNCATCHEPDNRGKANPLVLLDFPNQALVARHTLVEVLRGNKMPPRDPATGHDSGLRNEEVRDRLLDLAERFESEADAALAFEAGLRRSGVKP